MLTRPGSPHSKQQKPSPAAFQSDSRRPSPESNAIRPSRFPFWEAQPPAQTHNDCAGQVHPTASSRSLRPPLFNQIRADPRPKVLRSVLRGSHFGKPSPQPRPPRLSSQVHPTASSRSLSCPNFNANPLRIHSKVLRRTVLGKTAPPRNSPLTGSPLTGF